MDDARTNGRRHSRPAPTRRTFLWGMGGASVLLFGLGNRDGVKPIDHAELVGDPILTNTFDIVRAEDALVLTIKLYNLSLITIPGNPAYLTATDSTLPSYLVAEFPDQSVGEQAVQLSAQPTDTTYDFTQPTPVDINGYRASAFDQVQPTRLAFLITADLNPALEPDPGFGRNGLLDWLLFQQSTVGPITSSDAYTGPSDVQTSIGAPFGLAVSPTEGTGWLHSNTPVTDPRSGITEIWHTRLGAVIDPNVPNVYGEYPDVTPQVDGVFSNGFDPSVPPTSTPSDTLDTLVPLDSVARAEIVLDTSDEADYHSNLAPVDVHKLMLTSNGAWLDVHGAWTAKTGNALLGWSHRSTHGRDHEVIVASAGYLLPFGHPVTYIAKSVRRFETSPTGTPVANIRNFEYLIIRKQDRYLDPASAPNNPHNGRQLPFQRVRLDLKVTPNLTFQPLARADTGTPASGTGWCLANGAPYQFGVTAWDWEGNKHTFSVPMAFISADAATSDSTTEPMSTSPDIGKQPGSPEVVGAAYNNYSAQGSSGPGAPFVMTQLNGQPIALAASSNSGDTTSRVDAMTFGVSVVPNPPGANHFDYLGADEPRIFPVMLYATVRIPAVQTVSPGSATQIEYDSNYLINEFGPETNPGQLFLHVEGQPLSFDKGGNGTHPGVITPNMSVTGVSRSHGVAGGNTSQLAQYAQNHFTPTGFFDNAKLLGGLDLTSILAAGQNLTKAPLINSVRNYPLLPNNTPDLTKPPTITTTLSWTPALQDSPGSNPVFVQRDGGSALHLNATIVAAPNGAPPSTDVSGELRNFSLKLFGDNPAFLVLDFDEFSFHSRNGAKPTVKPKIANVTFAGPLAFINALEQFLPSGPGGNGITVTPTQVTASTSIAIPSVGFGVFSLSNLSFNGAVDIPFTSEPATVRFSFSTRDQPFLISVLIFGGGGFVGIALGSDGLKKLEASLEFGAHMGIDIGIASAAIEVMAGIYFAMAQGSLPNTQSTQLTGFVKAHGELNLAVVAVAITFYLSLTYLQQGSAQSVWGEVDVSLDIRVLLFSVTIHFSVRKEFAGGQDPTFADMYTASQWSEYAAAFA